MDSWIIYAETPCFSGVTSEGQLGVKEGSRLSEEEHRLAGVSRFHATLQRIVASWLKGEGFQVWLEHNVDGVHYADVYASNGVKSVIVEVETGYVPPMFITEAETYMLARAIVKAVKYACLADEFYIATPSYVRPPIPHVLLKPPEDGELLGASQLVRRFFGERWADEAVARLRDCRLAGFMLVEVARKSVTVLKGNDLRSYIDLE
ncbi:MAG: hypothetical protein ACP5HK_03115 [Acidilobus sp.]